MRSLAGESLLNKKDAKKLGLGQLSLVEHSLCPLDARDSTSDHLTHKSSFTYCDSNRHQKRGECIVRASFGLSPHDEFYLWGLLGLTFAQPEPTIDFRATPHYILRQLGKIDGAKNKGGYSYSQFRESLRRLAGVTYESDSFYDPIRGEHRRVAFGFLSYSLPASDESSRAWRIVWDPLFFEFCKATGGRLFFDLELYRNLDAKTRRLFLFLSKQFWRRDQTGWLDLEDVGYEVLGVARTVTLKRLKAEKIRDPMEKLAECGVLASATPKECFRKIGKGQFQVRFVRGDGYFSALAKSQTGKCEQALVELLESVGLNKPLIRSTMARYRSALLQEWVDITLAAKERFGEKFFKKGMAAYFLDNVKHATEGTRTAPDWWQEMRRENENSELAANPSTENLASKAAERERAFRDYLTKEAASSFRGLVGQMFSDFVDSGQSHEQAKKNAIDAVRTHLAKRFSIDHPEWN